MMIVLNVCDVYLKPLCRFGETLLFFFVALQFSMMHTKHLKNSNAAWMFLENKLQLVVVIVIEQF